MSYATSKRIGLPSPVFVSILALAVLGGVLAWNAEVGSTTSRFGAFLLVIAGWVVSLCLHEFGHAYTAWRFGDHDVAARGYLTLNPLKYTQVGLSIVLPLVFIALGGIGLPGGAVYLDTRYMTRRQRSLVALAGPLANAILAAVVLIPVAIYAPGSAHLSFWAALSFLGFLQLTALVLNLLPVPGLDGYVALEPHLQVSTQRSLEPAKSFGFLIIFAVLLIPPLNSAFFNGVYALFELSGVPEYYPALGSALSRFWTR